MGKIMQCNGVYKRAAKWQPTHSPNNPSIDRSMDRLNYNVNRPTAANPHVVFSQKPLLASIYPPFQIFLFFF